MDFNYKLLSFCKLILFVAAFLNTSCSTTGTTSSTNANDDSSEYCYSGINVVSDCGHDSLHKREHRPFGHDSLHKREHRPFSHDSSHKREHRPFSHDPLHRRNSLPERPAPLYVDPPKIETPSFNEPFKTYLPPPPSIPEPPKPSLPSASPW